MRGCDYVDIDLAEMHAGINRLIASFKDGSILQATSDIKSQLLKSNVTTAKDIDVIIASMALMFNNIINIFIELTDHVPRFDKNKSTDFFITCGKISKLEKFSVTQQTNYYTYTTKQYRYNNINNVAL